MQTRLSQTRLSKSRVPGSHRLRCSRPWGWAGGWGCSQGEFKIAARLMKCLESGNLVSHWNSASKYAPVAPHTFQRVVTLGRGSGRANSATDYQGQQSFINHHGRTNSSILVIHYPLNRQLNDGQARRARQRPRRTQSEALGNLHIRNQR